MCPTYDIQPPWKQMLKFGWIIYTVYDLGAHESRSRHRADHQDACIGYVSR